MVYESAETNIVFVIDGASGDVRILFNTEAHPVTIPELRNLETIFIFDAKAGPGHREPAWSLAFLILISSHNAQNYMVTVREMRTRCNIPSYTLEELLAVRNWFGVSEDAVRARCEEFGPSVRYVLVLDPESVRKQLQAKMEKVTVDDVRSITYGSSRVGADLSDASPSLMKVVADEEIYKNPNDAYGICNMNWYFASKRIMNSILANSGPSARRLVSGFVDATGCAACLRYSHQGLVAPFIARGGFKYKRLERTLSKKELTEMTLNRHQPLKISQERLDDTLLKHSDRDVLYDLAGPYFGKLYAANGFTEMYQLRGRSIPLQSMIKICKHVKKQDPHAKVKFFFVVTPAKYDTWRTEWAFDIGSDQLRAFENLPKAKQKVLENLEQYVISCSEYFDNAA